MDPMLGMVFMVPWNWAPLNYQLCQGQTLSLQQYEALYSLMGIVFGGDGSTKFSLPNLQGRVPLGTGVLGMSHYTLANTGGTQMLTLSQANLPTHTHAATFTGTGGGAGTTATASGTVTLAVSGSTTGMQATGSIAPKALSTQTSGGLNLPSATNNVVGRPSGTSANFYTANATDVALAATNVTLSTSGGTFTGTASGPVTLPVTGGGGGITGGNVAIGIAGGSAPIPTLPPYLAMTFIIAVNGLYPDRP